MQGGVVRWLGWALGALCVLAARAAAASEIEDALVIPASSTAPTTTSDAGDYTGETRTAHFTDHPLVIEGRMGVATTVGLMGFAAELSPADALVLNAGLGMNGLGATEELGFRLRPLWLASADGRQLHAFTLEAALSHSLYAGKPDFFPLDSSQDPTVVTARGVWWGQLEAGWEARFAQHLQVRVASGVAELLGQPSFSCYSLASRSSECDGIPRYLFTFTVGVGVAF